VKNLAGNRRISYGNKPVKILMCDDSLKTLCCRRCHKGRVNLKHESRKDLLEK